jgi:molecular chaperone Hsp33
MHPSIPLAMIVAALIPPRHFVGAFSTRVARASFRTSTHLLSSLGGEESASSSSSKTQEDPFHMYRNKNNIDDQVFSAMSKDGGIKVTACTIRNLVNDLMIQHTMTKTPSDILGRTIACSLLMANGIQDEQVVQITMNCKWIAAHVMTCLEW